MPHGCPVEIVQPAGKEVDVLQVSRALTSFFQGLFYISAIASPETSSTSPKGFASMGETSSQFSSMTEAITDVNMVNLDWRHVQKKWWGMRWG